MLNVKKVEKSDKYKLGENFTTNPTAGNPEDSSPSIFFDPTELFKEGINKEEFVNKYQELMAVSLFGAQIDESNNSIDTSTLSDEDLADIAEAAEKYFDSVDKDGNGILSEEEIGELAGIDGDSKSISDDDIKALTDELFNKETDAPEDPEVIEAPEGTDDTGRVGGGNGGGGGGGDYQVSSPKNNNDNPKTKTIKELQDEKSQKQTELDNARSELKTVYEQGDKNLNNAKEAYDNAVKNDTQISEELKQKQAENSAAISTKEQELGTLKSELVDVNTNISNYNSQIASKNAELSGLNAAAAELESATASDSEAKTRIDKKKSDIAERKKNLETEIQDLEDKLKEEEARKKELTETQIPKIEGDLKTLYDNKDAIAEQILENCSDATKTALEAYNTAKSDYDKAIQKAEKNIEDIQATINEYDEIINARKAIDTKNEYSESKCNYDFVLDGKTYKSIVPQDYAEKFLANEWAKGNYNHDSNCYQMAVQYCEDMMKDLGLTGSWHDINNDSVAVIEAKSKEMLDKGYPVVLHVSTKAGTRHFETAIGYLENDDGTIEFLCLDNVKGVGISTCGPNGYRHLMSGKESPYENQHVYGYRMMYKA